METQPKRSIPWPLIIAVIGVLGVLVLCWVAGVAGVTALIFSSDRTSGGQDTRTVGQQASRPAMREDEGPSARPAQAEGVAMEMAASNEAELQAPLGLVEVQAEGGDWMQAEPGQALQAGQRVRTAALSSAEIAFPDGSRMKLGPNSEISLDEVSTTASGERAVVLTQWLGESDHEVAPNKAQGSRYLVNTPSGSGEAKGTIFHVLVMAGEVSRFYVEEGAVAVTNLEVTVIVSAGQVTLVRLDEAPAEPVMGVRGEGPLTETGEAWVIAGQSFRLHPDTVILGDPQAGDYVLVEGRLLPDDTRLADLIVLVRRSPSNRFEISGPVSAKGESAWTIAGQTVLITSDTEIDTGIELGDGARAEGIILEDGSLEAEVIRVEDELRLSFEFTGVVHAVGEMFWTVSGTTFAINEDTAIEVEAAVGDLVQVRGWILEDGSWLAFRIWPVDEYGHDFQIVGTLDSMDPWQVSGVSFLTDEATVIAEGLAEGAIVRVKGEILEDGSWLATEIEPVSEELVSRMVFVGTVFSTDPWVISSIPVTIGADTVIVGEITPGMLVRVEVILLDGEWVVVSIQQVGGLAWFPGCMDITAMVVSIDGSRLQLTGWPLLTIGEDAQVEGDLQPNRVIRFRVCFQEDLTLVVTYIVIIDLDEVDEFIPVEGGKATVCHKPGKKKGGHTLNIAQAAVPAHLGHGDYLGPCR